MAAAILHVSLQYIEDHTASIVLKREPSWLGREGKKNSKFWSRKKKKKKKKKRCDHGNGARVSAEGIFEARGAAIVAIAVQAAGRRLVLRAAEVL